mmetsp:Transcript_36443/g.32713  ORF Transcript_36443/g.32713 Transcript_36443/m.32713 type:complete len:133 (+) Transcript_36443:800-1198(+)
MLKKKASMIVLKHPESFFSEELDKGKLFEYSRILMEKGDLYTGGRLELMALSWWYDIEFRLIKAGQLQPEKVKMDENKRYERVVYFVWREGKYGKHYDVVTARSVETGETVRVFDDIDKNAKGQALSIAEDA